MCPDRRRHDDNNKEVLQTLALISQLGFCMIIPIVLMFLFGMWLDKKLDTSYLAIVGFVIGAVAGGISVAKITSSLRH